MISDITFFTCPKF